MSVLAHKFTEQINLKGLGITLLILVALAFFLDIESLVVWVEKAGVWGPILFIALKALTIIIAPLSGTPLYPLVGLLYGFGPGILYIAIGDFLGYTISFYISRIFGRNAVNKLISKNEEGLLGRIIDHVGTPKGFFHACLTLVAMPELLSYGAGLTKLPYSKFILILLPLALIGASLLVFIGSILGTNESIIISLGLPAFAGVVALGGGYLFARSVQHRKNLE